MHIMRKALCCVRQEGLMLSRLSQKLILWDLCQLSRENPANSLCQRLGMLGKLSEVCLGFSEENVPQGVRLWVNSVYVCVCVCVCVCARV